MKRKLVLATVLTTMGISGAGFALAETKNASEASDQAEVQMFQAAKLDLNGASQKALAAQPGKLMEIGFNDENGKGVWEATILDTKGTAMVLQLDANSGAVLASGPESKFEADGDHQDEGAEHDEDGETNDG